MDKRFIATRIIDFRSVIGVRSHANIKDASFLVLHHIHVNVGITLFILDDRFRDKRRCSKDVQLDIIVLLIRGFLEKSRERHHIFVKRLEFLVKELSAVGELDVAARIFEQRNTQFVFELVDSLRKSRLHDAKILGTLRNMLRAGHLQKVFQLSQFHVCNYSK